MFLRRLDYDKLIQSDNLNQIIENNEYNRTNSELAAQAEITSYLAQRYITSEIFADLTAYSSSAVYGAEDIVEYTETTWSNATAYLIGDRVVKSSKIYEAQIGRAHV